MTSGNADSAFAQARATGEAAVARLVRFNEPGRMSLAGAYALGYGTLGMAQIEEDDPDWYDLLDPLDALVLGTAFPKRFASMYEFANARDRWLELLKGTVHGKGIEDFVRLCLRTSDEFRRPVDDGELMLVIAGQVEDARLDQRKLPVPCCRDSTGRHPPYRRPLGHRGSATGRARSLRPGRPIPEDDRAGSRRRA
jgi:hypothetical protein